MKRWFRTHEIRIYQFLFLGVILLTVIILTGRIIPIPNLFESVAKAVIKFVEKEENPRISYLNEEHGEEKLFTGLTGFHWNVLLEEEEVLPAISDKIEQAEQEDLNESAGIFSEVFLEQSLEFSDEKILQNNTEQDALEELAQRENGLIKDIPKLEVKKQPGKVTPLPKQENTKSEEPKNSQESKGQEKEGETKVVSVRRLLTTEYSLEKMKNLNYLLANFYIVDSSTKATASLFQSEVLLNKDLTIEKSDDEIQILIYHTHASEMYSDSRKGVQEDTVVGPGNYLTELLEKKGYVVYHDQTAYDKKDGKDNRNYAYSTARPHIEKFLKEHPSVEVVIDLHRDSGTKRVTMINGKETAQIMFFNGLCRNANGPIVDLENPYILDNLAFSLQSNLVGRSMYPGLMYKIYLKNYRYNQHLCPRYLLIELGTQQNTVKEAYNAMEPLAEILDQVLTNP